MHDKPYELRVKTSGFIMQVEVLDTNMGKKRDFTENYVYVRLWQVYAGNSQKYESRPSNY